MGKNGKILSDSASYNLNIDDKKNVEISITYNSDSEEVPESKIKISLKNLSYRANNLTKNEFKKIFDDITVPLTNIYHFDEEEEKQLDIDFK